MSARSLLHLCEALQRLLGEAAPGPRWVRPSARAEHGELKRVAADEKVPVKDLHHAMKSGVLKPLHGATWKRLQNTDSHGTNTLRKARKLANQYGRDISQIEKGFREGHKMHAPIILKRHDGTHTLVGGNTRLMTAKAMGVRPHALHITLPKPSKK